MCIVVAASVHSFIISRNTYMPHQQGTMSKSRSSNDPISSSYRERNDFLLQSSKSFDVSTDNQRKSLQETYTSEELSQNEIVAQKIRKGSTPEFAIDGDSTEETLQQRLVLMTHFLMLAVNLAIVYQSIAAAAGVSQIFNIYQMIATVMSSIVLGDFATGVFHWSVDNYGGLNTPVFGKVCAAFQGHHVTPWTITFRPFANNVYKIAYGTIPALVVLAIAPCSIYVRTFFALFINWWLLSQEFHKYSHMRQVPPVMKFLQDSKIILSKKEHGLHHTSPFEGHYCILTGVCNPILDRLNFFRYLEKAVYLMTGAS